VRFAWQQTGNAANRRSGRWLRFNAKHRAARLKLKATGHGAHPWLKHFRLEKL
jgi:hypothetical protein